METKADQRGKVTLNDDQQKILDQVKEAVREIQGRPPSLRGPFVIREFATRAKTKV
jgi:hypothetical protein